MSCERFMNFKKTINFDQHKIQTLILEDYFTHLKIFNIHIIQTAQLSMIHMLLKWDRINKCNKNNKTIDVLTLILACLNSYVTM